MRPTRGGWRASLLVFSGGVIAWIVTTPALAQPPRPNVVLIYGDDVGWGDIGCQGGGRIPTPNIDRLAAEGLRFTDGHCTAATCTPSRYALLTGVHGFRQDIRVLPPEAPLVVDPDRLTLADLFRNAGYQTAIVGKWHLGLGNADQPVDWNGEISPGPLVLGFDHSFILPSTNDRVPCVLVDGHRVHNLDPADPLKISNRVPDWADETFPDGRQRPEAMTYYRSTHGHNGSVINGIGRIGYQRGGRAALWNDENLSDDLVARAASWLDQREVNKPFFLWYSAADIHVPRAPHPRFQGRTGLGHRGDAMVQLDDAAGTLLKLLDDAGLAENTIVIFSSDNGPVYDDGYHDGTEGQNPSDEASLPHDGSGPWRGGKYMPWEGGTRVPFIVRWPARIRPGVSEALVSQVDLMASFAALLEQPLPHDEAIDSRDTLAAFLGEDRAGLPWLVEEAGQLALREGPWKLVLPPSGPAGKNGQPTAAQLFDLASDPGETTDVAAVHPERVVSMTQLLDAIRASQDGLRALKGP